MNKIIKDINIDDDVDVDNELNLFSREEKPLLCIAINCDNIKLNNAAHDKEEECFKTTTNSILRLKQFNTNHDSWGIHSTVWEGGLATLAYIIHQTKEFDYDKHSSHSLLPLMCLNNKQKERKKTIILDLGSGTGIVGLGVALFLNKERQYYNEEDNNIFERDKDDRHFYHIILTDIPEALPLLESNMSLYDDDIATIKNDDVKVSIMPLSWGSESLPELLCNTIKGSHNVMIIGADIIYRPSLFHPLLQTLKNIFKFCDTVTSIKNVECYFGSLSTRSYIFDFFNLAATSKYGFIVDSIASVGVPEDDDDHNNIIPDDYQILHCANDDGNNNSTGATINTLLKGSEIVSIFKVHNNLK